MCLQRTHAWRVPTHDSVPLTLVQELSRALSGASQSCEGGACSTGQAVVRLSCGRFFTGQQVRAILAVSAPFVQLHYSPSACSLPCLTSHRYWLLHEPKAFAIPPPQPPSVFHILQGQGLQWIRAHSGPEEERCRRRVSATARAAIASHSVLFAAVMGGGRGVIQGRYWMNTQLLHNAPNMACINASVEESTISSRDSRCVFALSLQPLAVVC